MRYDPEWADSTIRALYYQGALSVELIPRERRHLVEGLAICEHRHTPAVSVTKRCVMCNLTWSERLDEAFALALVQVRQGLVEAEDAVSPTFSDDENETLRNAAVCLHPVTHRRPCNCVGYATKCLDCGRKFTEAESIEAEARRGT